MTRSIGFLVFPDFEILDLTGPLSAFDAAGRCVAPSAYGLQVLSEHGGPVSSSSGLEVLTRPIGDGAFDTIVVAGGSGVYAATSSPVLAGFLQSAAATSLGPNYSMPACKISPGPSPRSRNTGPR